MKLRYIITSLVVALMAIAGCTKEELGHLEEVQVSQSYLAFPQSGGSVSIKVTASESWTITDIPEWLTVSPTSGGAGSHEVTFSAGATTETYQSIVYLNCAGAQQQLTVLQQAAKVEIPVSSCKEVNDGEDGKTYRVSGTVTSIANTKYGNFYINDGTGEVYIYGTLYEGQEEKFLEHGIEVGDKVTVEGPRKTYNGTIELVDVTVINIEKSLIKVESVSPEDAVLPIEGGEFIVTLTCKGDGVKVIVDESIQSWVQVSGISTSGNTAVVTFKVAANPGGDREAEVSFETTSGGEKYAAKTSFTQKGAIIDATVAMFLAAEESSTLYRVSGVIKSISVSEQYHNASIYLLGGGGEEVQLYRAVGPEGTNIEDLGLAEGDFVTFLGKRSSYNGTPQMAAGGVYVSHTHYVAKTIAEFIAAKDSNTPYLVKGTIVGTPSVAADYNNANFTIKDETGELYLYRASSFDKTAIETIGLEEGKVVTIAGKYGEYNSKPQMAQGGLILMVEEGQGPTPPPADEIVDANAAAINAAADGETKYRITGYVSSIANDVYGNLYLKDATGEVYVYGVLDAEGNSKNFSSLGIKAGDIITVVGPKTSYNNAPQMKNVSVEAIKSVEAVTVAQFLAKSESTDIYYSITGKVANIQNTSYGNFDIVDETGSVYVYGLTNGWGGSGKQFASFNIKEGDQLTILGVRTSYKETIQVGSAFYVDHKPASGEVVSGGVEFLLNSSLGVENGTEITTLTKDGITLTFDKGTNNNAPKYYSTGDAVRVYGGGTVTVSGAKMSKIEISFSSGEGSNEITASTGSYADGVWQGDADSVVFTVGGTSGHRRFAKIVVTKK